MLGALPPLPSVIMCCTDLLPTEMDAQVVFTAIRRSCRGSEVSFGGEYSFDAQ